MDEGGYVRILRRPAILPLGTLDAGSPLSVPVLIEALRDRANVPALIGPTAAPKPRRI